MLDREANMFRGLNDYRAERPQRRRKPTVSLSARQQNILIAAICIELFLLFAAPICGASVIGALISLVKFI
jgi:hypothetical protein